jgi:hypothetical protein
VFWLSILKPNYSSNTARMYYFKSAWVENCSSVHRKSKSMAAALTHIALRLFWKIKGKKFWNERNTLHIILNIWYLIVTNKESFDGDLISPLLAQLNCNNDMSFWLFQRHNVINSIKFLKKLKISISSNFILFYFISFYFVLLKFTYASHHVTAQYSKYWFHRCLMIFTALTNFYLEQ